MKICPYCGSQLRDDAVFCTHCGKPYQAPAAQPGGTAVPAGNRYPNSYVMNNGYQGYGNNAYTNPPQRKSPLIAVVIVLAVILVIGIAVLALMLGKGGDSSRKESAASGTTVTQTSGEEKTAKEESAALTAAREYHNKAKGFQDHAYAIFNFKKLGLQSFDECEQYCEDMGGHLAVIDSQEENDFIYGYLTDAGYHCALFGFTDQQQEGVWQWVNGSESGYTNWCQESGLEQPNNGEGAYNSNGVAENYAEFYELATNGTWNDAPFAVNTYLFICEWE